MDSLLEHIEDVWGGHDDFSSRGFEYVAFLIESDIEDMREDGFDEDETAEELCDIVINALRALSELTDDDPAEQLHARLDDRMAGQTEALIETYGALYDSQAEKTA
jgi:hypothetical protein